MSADKNLAALVFGCALLFAPLAFAATPSLSVQSISPSGAVSVNRNVTFTAAPSGFSPTLFIVSDAFGTTTTVSNSNIITIGNKGEFTWAPVASDIGTHQLTITGSDNIGNAASTTATIVVTPAPSISIQSLLPGATVLPGAKLTFNVASPGFTNPSFSLGDSFSGTAGTSITTANIDASGNFSWTPDVGQQGEHVLTVYARDSLGHSASISQNLRVGSDASLTIFPPPPAGGVKPGQILTFTASAQGYWPTAFTVLDTFTSANVPVTNTSITNSNINSSGLFTWTPLASDFGTHVLKITGTIGAFGQSASTTQTVIVLGPGGVAPPPLVTAAVSASPASAATSTSSASSTASASVAGSASGSASSTASAALLEQIAKVQAQIAALTNSPTAPSSGGVFSTNLREGQTSDIVLQLQKVLAQQGFLTATPNGHFGPATVAAVKKFQAANGLPTVGSVGPATRAALNALPASSSGTASASASTAAGDKYVFKNFIGLRDNGTDVLELQKRLAALGFFSGEATGYFGSVTEAAVKKFQTANGIKAAGYVGPGTRAVLNQ